MNHYDAIVLGTGGVGSAAVFHLARRGARVLGIDRFPGGHDRGSSHGQTRIIRQAYFEHPDYVPLLLRAYDLWHELETACAEQLLHRVGLLQIGPPEGPVVRGVLASAQLHGLEVHQLSVADILRRWPGLSIPDSYVGVFEPAAGYLRVESCVLAHLAQAAKCGAAFRFGEAARSFRRAGSHIAVELESGGVLHADKLVISAGPWAPQFLAGLGIPLFVRRKHAYWFAAADRYSPSQGFPTFLFELPHGVFYGFPQIDELGLKAAEHSGGEVVSDPLADPRAFDLHDLARVRDFLLTCLPGVGRSYTRHSVCYYTMSPDEHFIVDQLPDMPNVLFAAGLSGHGFKFTSVLGQALAEMTLDGKTSLPVGFLGLNRFRLANRSQQAASEST